MGEKTNIIITIQYLSLLFEYFSLNKIEFIAPLNFNHCNCIFILQILKDEFLIFIFHKLKQKTGGRELSTQIT